MTESQTETPKLRVEELAEYHKLEDERRTLNRKSRMIDDRMKFLEKRFFEYLVSIGKDQAKRKEFLAAIESVPGRAAWKEEFILILGVEAAQKVIEAVPPRRRVVVKKVT